MSILVSLDISTRRCLHRATNYCVYWTPVRTRQSKGPSLTATPVYAKRERGTWEGSYKKEHKRGTFVQYSLLCTVSCRWRIDINITKTRPSSADRSKTPRLRCWYIKRTRMDARKKRNQKRSQICGIARYLQSVAVIINPTLPSYRHRPRLLASCRSALPVRRPLVSPRPRLQSAR